MKDKLVNDLIIECLAQRPEARLQEALSSAWAPYGVSIKWLDTTIPACPEVTVQDGRVEGIALGVPPRGAVQIVRCSQLSVNGALTSVCDLGEDWRISPAWRNTVLTTCADPEQVGPALARVILGWSGTSDLSIGPVSPQARLHLTSLQAQLARDRVSFELQEPPHQERGRILWVFADPYTDTLAGPYGLEILSHISRVHGFMTRITNPYLENLDPIEGLRRQVDSYQPHLIGISLRNIDDALIVRTVDGDSETVDVHDLLKEVRQLCSSLANFHGPVIMGGAAFGTAPEALLSWVGLDYGVIGAAETAITQLCQQWTPMAPTTDPAIDFHQAWVKLPGAVWREDGVFRRNSPPRGRELTQPAVIQRSLPYLLLDRRNRLPVGVRGSQGCAMGCSYCVESVNRKAISWRSVSEVVDEMAFLYDRYGIRVFHLTDSEANIPFRRLTDLAKEIMQRRLAGRILWTAYLNAIPFEPLAVPLLAASGLYKLKFAFDHFHDQILHGYHKNFRELDLLTLLDGLAPFLDRTQVLLGILLGGPGETEATLAYAIERMKTAAARGFILYYNTGVRIYPGTPFWDRYMATPDEPGYYGAGQSDAGMSPLVYSAPLPPRQLAAFLEERFAGEERIFRMNQESSGALGYEGYRRFLIAWHASLHGRTEEAVSILDGIPQLAADRQASAFRRWLRMHQRGTGVARR